MISVLFPRKDSIYKSIPGLDVWDADRDARLYEGSNPVICHPPCRAWGNLSHLANPSPGEMNLARLSISLVRAFGGVVEHPITSKLWKEQLRVSPGQRDSFGGFFLPVDQFYWGHKARKRTGLYIVGTSPGDVPLMPWSLSEPEFVVGGSPGYKDISKSDRERTPEAFANWLVDLVGVRDCSKIEQSPRTITSGLYCEYSNSQVRTLP